MKMRLRNLRRSKLHSSTINKVHCSHPIRMVSWIRPGGIKYQAKSPSEAAGDCVGFVVFLAPPALFVSLASRDGFCSNLLVLLHFHCNPGQALKRRSPSPAAEQLKGVVEEQAAVIESLRSDKKELQSSLESLKSDHERAAKENHILRKAVQIQQDRQSQAENELKNAQKYREGAEEQIRKMEQVILSLRYHLQAQQSSVGNDFMGMPPPNVF